MRPRNYHWRALCRIFAGLLLFVGLFVAYWWFYKLGPARHTLDPQWWSRHSRQEYWREVQKGIHRGMWFHDDGFTVGMYGDKSWAEWIMGHVKPGTSMGCLGGDPCHSATAMRYITNQDVGQEADAWLDWWENNKSKTQEEWIADGFAQRGFKIDVPPRPEQIPLALTLLGAIETEDSTDIDRTMKYNAFRCLRDSGFDPMGFALSNRTLSTNAHRGLLEYAKYERRFPEADGVGILPFGKKDEDGENDFPPEMLTPQFQIAAYSLVFGPLTLGTLLIVWSFRNRKQSVESRSEPHRVDTHVHR
jgi:hypothetical protein